MEILNKSQSWNKNQMQLIQSNNQIDLIKNKQKILNTCIKTYLQQKL